jgi:hypothetical protein
MSFVSLSKFIVELREIVIGGGLGPYHSSSLRLKAAALAMQYTKSPVGHEAELELVNCAALAVSMQEKMVVHQLSPQAVDLVKLTDLKHAPIDCPKILMGPWIVEVRNPEKEVFFDNVVGMGGYKTEDGKQYMIIWCYPDGCAVAEVKWFFDGRPIEESEIGDDIVLPENRAKYYNILDQANRFILTLAELLDAEGAPILERDEHRIPKKREGRKKTKNMLNAWVVKYISLTKDNEKKHVEARFSDSSLVRDNANLIQTMVTGHIKNQVYGPGNTLRKKVYIRSYESRRWVSKRPTKVVVN